MNTKEEIQNTLSFVTQILKDDVLPFFELPETTITDDAKNIIITKFAEVQSSIIALYSNINDDLENNLTLIDSKINNSLSNLLALDTIDYRSNVNPSHDTNPTRENGALWLNYSTGVIYVCVKNDLNNNIWIGSNGDVISFNTKNVFDVFGDSGSTALFPFESDYNDLGGLYSLSLLAGSITYHSTALGDCARINGRLKLSSRDLMPYSGQDYSVSFYFMPDSTGDNYIFCQDSTASTISGFKLNYNKTNQTFNLKFPTTGSQSTAIQITTHKVPNFNDLELHHIGLTVDKVKGLAKIYLDGELIFMMSNVPFTEYNNGWGMYIGSTSTTVETAYTISPLYLKQMRFFNYALSDAEMMNLKKEIRPL